MKLSLVLTGLLVGTAVFVGCGGSSSPSEPELRTGILTDSPIAGVSYSCGEITGTTTSEGKFSCKVAPITFKIGGLTLGTVSAFTADGKVFPQDLVGVARTNFTDTELIGLTRLLQSLDDDGDISSTINILPSAAAKFGSDATGTDWVALAGAAGVSLVSAEDAMEHLQGTLNPTAKSLLAGKTLWTGIYGNTGTLERLVFNADMTEVVWTEIVGGSESDTSVISALSGLGFTATDSDGAVELLITGIQNDYLLVKEGTEAPSRVYFDEAKARAYFLATDSGSGGNTDNGTWVPVTNNFTCDPAPTTVQGYSLDTRYAAEGDISVECQTMAGYTFPQYVLGVASLDITQIIKVEEYRGTVSEGTFIGTDTHDFSAGTIHVQRSGLGGDIDCVETYVSILPTTIDTVSKLESVIEYSPGLELLTHTTCPDSLYDDGIDDDEYGVGTGSGSFRENITLTDSTGKIHKISTEVTSGQ